MQKYLESASIDVQGEKLRFLIILRLVIFLQEQFQKQVTFEISS